MSEPCVIARLGGGLGNQLFMYAFNKAMAERNRVPLKLDIVGGFERDRTYQRSHLLDHLLPAETTASRWEARRFPSVIVCASSNAGSMRTGRWMNAAMSKNRTCAITRR